MSQYTPILRRVGTREDGGFALPVMTFHPRWHRTLKAIADSPPPEPRLVELDWFVESSGGPCVDYMTDFDDQPQAVKDDLVEMAASLWHEHYDEPAGLMHLTGMMDHVGGHIQEFFVLLKRAVVRLTKHPSAAMVVPVGPNSGSSDNSFPPHQDMFPCLYNLSVYAKPAPGGQGASVFVPTQRFMELVKQLVPARRATEILTIMERRTPWTPEHYVRAFDAGDYEVHSDPYGLLRAVLNDPATWQVHYGHGEGYWIEEGPVGTMHGRTPRDKEHNPGRMHRLTYDTKQSFERRAALGGDWVV